MDHIQATRHWVNTFVLKHNLCPFAHQPMLDKTVLFTECKATDFDELAKHFFAEVLRISEQPATEVMTTLIVYPNALADFYDFLDFIEAMEAKMSNVQADELVQLAHFHPDYQFGGVPATDPANATNRSPFPVIQLLRVEEMSAAIDAYPDVDGIPDRNIALLRKLAAGPGHP